MQECSHRSLKNYLAQALSINDACALGENNEHYGKKRWQQGFRCS